MKKLTSSFRYRVLVLGLSFGFALVQSTARATGKHGGPINLEPETESTNSHNTADVSQQMANLMRIYGENPVVERHFPGKGSNNYCPWNFATKSWKESSDPDTVIFITEEPGERRLPSGEAPQPSVMAVNKYGTFTFAFPAGWEGGSFTIKVPGPGVMRFYMEKYSDPIKDEYKDSLYYLRAPSNSEASETILEPTITQVPAYGFAFLKDAVAQMRNQLRTGKYRTTSDFSNRPFPIHD